MGEAAGATISLIPEEFGSGKLSFRKVADILTGSIIKRISMNRDHGVAILAEGIIEKFDIEELSQYEDIERNEKGELKLSEIQLGKLLKGFVNKTLEPMGIKTSIVDKNIGYELRAADPIPFDVEYVRSLGYGAIHYLLKGGTGSMIVCYEGNIEPIPFVEMLDDKSGRMRIKKVDVCSGPYEVARKYMIRLEKEDFEGEKLKKLAKIAHMKPEEFKERFKHILSND
jgi:6-phosphofructokinase 1